MVAAAKPPSRISLRRGTASVGHGWRKFRSNRWGRRALRLLALLGILYGVFWITVARTLPDASALLKYEPPLPTNVRSIDGSPVYSYARERRVQLAFDEYPKQLVNAYLAAEDKTFFDHGGIDYPGIVRAVFTNITTSGRPVGASTITQQVAKNLLIGNQVSYTRKLKEAVLAYRIEDTLTKQQILELYLNQIALGRNAFGVQSAARAYFAKDVDELSLPEMAYLAILPKGPSNYRPERFYDRAIARRNWVLGQMLENKAIDASQHAAAVAEPLRVVQRATAKDDVAGYFTEEVRRQLIEKFGETAKKGPHSVYEGGLWVRTSLDPKMQRATEDALRAGLIRFDAGRGWSGPLGQSKVGDKWQLEFGAKNIGVTYKDWRTAVVLTKGAGTAELGFADGTTGRMPASAASMPRRGGGAAFTWLKPGDIIAVAPQGGGFALRNVPEVSGGMVAENPHTGQVLAMQGGFDAKLASFNRATQALRQPGSTFKPFVYAAALDAGMTPASIIVDGSFCVYQGGRLGNKCFRNFGGAGGAGPQTMRWGLEQSRNLMTVRAASQTGMANVVRLAANVGISEPGKPYPTNLAVSLGAGDTTVARLVNAYSILANNGRTTTQTVIDFVQDRAGKVIYRADTRPCDRCNLAEYDGKPMPRPRPRSRQVMDAMTAYQMVHILEGVVQRGTATVLRDLKRPIFGKTGTTSGPNDVWFAGGSADLIAGVYIGFDQPRSLGGAAQGGRIAAPIFKQFADVAMKDMPVVPFRAPAGIRMVRIDRRSGKRVYGSWPGDDPKSAVIWEAFKPESEPRRSARNDELPVIVRRAAAPAVVRRQARRETRDSDFLQSQGGIY